MKPQECKKAIEAGLFMAARPITVNEIQKISNVEEYGIALKLIEDFMKEFNEKDSGLEIIKIGSTKYQMKVKEQYNDQVSHLAVDVELSKAILRCLGLIAVKQPIKQSIVVHIIGNKAYNYIPELVEKGFIKAQKAGTTKMLTTTSKFENYFGKEASEINKKLGAEYQSTLGK